MRNPGRGPMAAVGNTAAMKVVVMGLSGVLGILTARLINGHFGRDAFAQYGLLTTITNLLPFADLGLAAVVINTIAGSDDPRRDERVRAVVTTTLRILIGSGSAIAGVAILIMLLDGWPTLLGQGMLPDSGPLAATLCLVIFGAVLPLTIGQRILVGMQRTTTQVATQAVVSPVMFASVALLVLFSVPAGGYLAVFSYAANALISVICIVISARLLSPQLRLALRDVPRLRSVPGVHVRSTAWPMLAQMLALPVAMQTDRLLISHLATGKELAQYNLASQLFGLVLQTISTAGVALWPIYAKARENSSIQSPARPTVYFLSGGLVLGGLLAAVSPWLVDFASNGKIELDGWLVGGFVIFAALQASKYPVGMYMTDKAGLQFQVLPILIMVPCNLLISWWLIGLIGPGGTIIASAVTVAACQVLPNLWYVRRDLARRRAAAATEPPVAGPGAHADGEGETLTATRD